MKDAGPRLSARSLTALFRGRGERVMWIEGDRVVTWEEFADLVERVITLCSQAGGMTSDGAVMVIPGDGSLESLTWLCAGATLGGVVAPLRQERRVEVETWKTFLRIDGQVEQGRLVPDGGGTNTPSVSALIEELLKRKHAGLILATGGTTGVAKVVLHDLETMLSTLVVQAGSETRRILPLMRFDHIGGLDIVWRAIANGDTLVAPPRELTATEVASVVARAGVEVLPATPSFLNLLLLSGAERAYDLSSLRIVPYGAEPMPPAVLARLREALPRVAFVERFGTSETGAIPVKSTGEGLAIPASAKSYSWKVVEGELWVRSATRALGYLSGQRMECDDDGWFKTGDLAEQASDGSIRVLGRRSSLINVGGEKVLPGFVENMLLTHPHVVDCRVRAQTNVLLGQIVVADIVWSTPGGDALSVKRTLHDFAATLLPKSHLPAIVRVVGAIDTTSNLKKSFRPCPESS